MCLAKNLVYLIVARPRCQLSRHLTTTLFSKTIARCGWPWFSLIFTWSGIGGFFHLTSFTISNFRTLWSSFQHVFISVVGSRTWRRWFWLLKATAIQRKLRTFVKDRSRIVCTRAWIVFTRVGICPLTFANTVSLSIPFKSFIKDILNK